MGAETEDGVGSGAGAEAEDGVGSGVGPEADDGVISGDGAEAEDGVSSGTRRAEDGVGSIDVGGGGGSSVAGGAEGGVGSVGAAGGGGGGGGGVGKRGKIGAPDEISPSGLIWTPAATSSSKSSSRVGTAVSLTCSQSSGVIYWRRAYLFLHLVRRRTAYALTSRKVILILGTSSCHDTCDINFSVC